MKRTNTTEIPSTIGADADSDSDTDPTFGWVGSFKTRHASELRPTNIVYIEPERQEVAYEDLDRYFVLLKELLDRYQFHSDLICNFDETMVVVDMKTRKRTLVPRGTRIGVARGSSDCVHITALVCGFATGRLSINPLVIVPQREIPGDLPDDVIQVLDWATNDSGWITAEILLDWVQKTFIPTIQSRRLLLGKTQEEAPALLLVDNHSSRMNSRFVEVMRANNIVVFTFVPHSSHLTQPMDVHAFQILKTHLSGLTSKLNNTTVADRKLAVLTHVRDAVDAACNNRSMIISFRKAGIVPFNPSAVYANPRCPAPAAETATHDADATGEGGGPSESQESGPGALPGAQDVPPRRRRSGVSAGCGSLTSEDAYRRILEVESRRRAKKRPNTPATNAPRSRRSVATAANSTP